MLVMVSCMDESVTYVHKCSQILTKSYLVDTAAQDFLVKYNHGHI